MKRKILLIGTGLLLIAGAVYYYIDTVFLPVQFKQYVLAKAEQWSGRKVYLDNVDFSLFHGFTFENLTVARKDDPRKPFLEIRHARFNILLTPFLRKKAMIIPTLKISDPYLYLKLDKDGRWNFADLFEARKDIPRAGFPAVLLRKLSIHRGTVSYVDFRGQSPFRETVKNIHLDSTLSINKGIRFIAGAQIPESKTVFKIKGNYILPARRLTAQAAVKNIDATRYWTLIGLSRPGFQLQAGQITSADLSLTYAHDFFGIDGNIEAAGTNIVFGAGNTIKGPIKIPDIHLTRQGGQWAARALIDTDGILLSTHDGKEIKGDLTADIRQALLDDNRFTIQGNAALKNAHVRINESSALSGTLLAQNTSVTMTQGAITLTGDIHMNESILTSGSNTSVKGSLTAKGAEITWSPPNDQGRRKLLIESPISIDPVVFTSGNNRLARGTVNAPKTRILSEPGQYSVESQGQILNASLHLGEQQELRGDPYFNITFRHDDEKKIPDDYEGTFNFSRGAVTGVAYVDTIENMEGTITFKPGLVTSKKLTFTTLGSGIQLSGQAINFHNPKLDIKISSENIKLETVSAFFPGLKEKLNAGITGTAVVKGVYKGSVKNPGNAVIAGSVDLSDTTVTHVALDGEVSGGSGRIDYKQDLVTWKGLTANYKNKTYTSDGQLINFSRPVLTASLKSNHLTLDTQINVLNQAFQIAALNGTYLHSRFNLKGDVHTFPKTPADIDLRGQFDVDVQDTGALIPALRPKMKSLDPKGVLSGTGIFKGKFRDWQHWQLAFDARSSEIRLNKYPLKNIVVRYTQRDETISKCDISAQLYNGALTVRSTADLRTPAMPFIATVLLERLDLEQWRIDRKTKNNLLDGDVMLTTALQGSLARWQEMTGDGTLAIKDGYLWQWNILDGISGLLLIPEFKTMVFTEATADFVIQDQKVHTANARLKSKTTTLLGKGWVDFDKNLNFDITPIFSELAILQSPSMKKRSTSVITQTKGYLNIKLTGTLDHPQHTIEKFPLKIIEETIGGTTGTLKEVIGSIVDEIF